MTGGEVTLADHVAAAVRAERARRKWTQVELAQRAGLSATTIGDLEQGKRAVRVDDLPRLCRAFGLPLASLTQGADRADIEALGLWSA
jgi:transcriptional regulator with XRE-family HTH domain